MEAGIPIDVIETVLAGQSVDTQEDLEVIKKIMMNLQNEHQATGSCSVKGS